MSRKARPDTVTVYNYVGTAAGVATFQRTVLERVALDRAYRQRLNNRGIQTEDAALLVLDLSDLQATDSRVFTTPEKWVALTTAEKAGYFTFGPQDFFVEGTAIETLPTDTKATMQTKHRIYAVSELGLPASDTAIAGQVEVTAR